MRLSVLLQSCSDGQLLYQLFDTIIKQCKTGKSQDELLLSGDDWAQLAERCPGEMLPDFLFCCPVQSVRDEIVADICANISALLSRRNDDIDSDAGDHDDRLLDAFRCFCSSPSLVYPSPAAASQTFIQLLTCHSDGNEPSSVHRQIRKLLVSEGLKQILSYSDGADISLSAMRLWELAMELIGSEYDFADGIRMASQFIDFYADYNFDDDVKRQFCLQMANDDRLYEGVITSMTYNVNAIRKLGCFLLRKIIGYISKRNIASLLKTKYLNGCSLEPNVWSDFITLFEVLNETNNHLVEPILPLFTRITSSSSIAFVWIKVLFKQCSQNTSSRIRSLIYRYLMSNASEASLKVYTDNFEFIFGDFARYVCDMTFFAEANTSRTNVSDFGELLESFLARLLSRVDRCHFQHVFELMSSGFISLNVAFIYYVAGLRRFCNNAPKLQWSHAEISALCDLANSNICSIKCHMQTVKYFLEEIIMAGLDVTTSVEDIARIIHLLFPVLMKQPSSQDKLKAFLTSFDFTGEFHNYMLRNFDHVVKLTAGDVAVTDMGKAIAFLIIAAKDVLPIQTCLASLAVIKIHRKPHLHENIRLFLKSIFVEIERSACQEERTAFIAIFKYDLIHIISVEIEICFKESISISDMSVDAAKALFNYRSVDNDISSTVRTISLALHQHIRQYVNRDNNNARLDNYLKLIIPGILDDSNFLDMIVNGAIHPETINAKWYFVMNRFSSTLKPHIHGLLERALDDLCICHQSDIHLILAAIRLLLEQCDVVLENGLIEHIIGACSKRCFVVSSNNELALFNFVDVLTCKLLICNQEYSEVFINTVVHLFQYAGFGKTSVLLKFTQKFIGQLSSLCPATRNRTLITLYDAFYLLISYGPSRDRFERFDLVFENKIRCILKARDDELFEPIIVLDAEIRACAISLLVKLDKQCCEAAVFLTRSLVDKLKVPIKGQNISGFAVAQRERFRICQAVLIVIDLVESETDQQDFILDFLALLKLETLSSLKTLLLWIVIRIITKVPALFELVRDQLDLFTGNASECVSALSITFGVYETFWSKKDQFYCKNWIANLPRYLFPAMVNNKHVVRLHAFRVVDLARRTDSFHEDEYSSLYVRFITSNRDILKEKVRLNDPIFAEFENDKCFNLHWIFYRFLQIIDAPFEELIHLHLWWKYIKPAEARLPINDPRKLQTLHPATVAELNVNDSSESIEETSFQKKFIPQKEAFDTENGRSSRKSSDLVVVASLLDKSTNLGGLCRTCEIFGGSLVLPDLKIIQDKSFQTMSVTSENWVPVSEVKADALGEYFRNAKKQGYKIVAVEQTGDSASLTEFVFPKKTILLLGSEKRGIPVDLLESADACVEIPQFGFIRSLNVHVAASLCIYEYVKHHPKI